MRYFLVLFSKKMFVLMRLREYRGIANVLKLRRNIVKKKTQQLAYRNLWLICEFEKAVNIPM